MPYFRCQKIGGGAEPILWVDIMSATSAQQIAYKTFDDSISCNYQSGYTGGTNVSYIFTFANAFKGKLYTTKLYRGGSNTYQVIVGGVTTTIVSTDIQEISLDLQASETVTLKVVNSGSSGNANAMGVLITK